MSDMDDLITWLRAQLDEDAEAERRTPGGTWDYDPTDGWITNEDSHVLAIGDGAPEAIDHVTRYSPSFVRADIAAKRALLLQFELRGNATRAAIQPPIGGVWDDLLRMLASAYAHRDGYREEWRPA